MNYNKIQKSEVLNYGWLKKFSLNKALVAIYVLVLALGIFNLIGTNALATQGVVLDQILSQTQKITKENQEVSVQIGKLTNLSYIESIATQHGFQRIKNSYLITGNEAVAAAIR